MSDFIPHWKSPPPPGDDSVSGCDGVTDCEIGDAIGKEGLGNAMDGLIYGNGTEKMETSEDEIDSLPELSEDDFSGESPPQSSLSSLSMDQQRMRDVKTGISPSGHQETLAKDAGLSIDPMIQYANDAFCQSGPITVRDVVIKRRDSDPPILFPNRRTGSRLTSGSSSGSSLKGFKPRRTQKEMKSMTKEEKRELQKSQGRANFKNSLQKKKNKKASLEEHSKGLDVELRDGQESLKQLEAAYKEKFPDLIALKNNVAQLIEKENQDSREKLKEEVRKLETKLEAIAKERNRKGTKKTTNASAKCRTNQKLEIATLELKVHQQETKIEQMAMIMEYLKEALGVKSMEDSISRQCHQDTNIVNYFKFDGNSEGFSNFIPVDYNKEVFDNQMDSTGGPMLPAEEQSATAVKLAEKVLSQTFSPPFDDFSINHGQHAGNSVHHMDATKMDQNFRNSSGFNFSEGNMEPLTGDSAPPLSCADYEMTENSNCHVPQFGESVPLENIYLQSQYNYGRIPSKDPYSLSIQEIDNVSDQSSAQWTLPPISAIFTNSERSREAPPAISSAGMGTNEFVGNEMGWNQPPGFPDDRTMVSSSGLPYPNSGKIGQQYLASPSNTWNQNTNYGTMQEQYFSTSRPAIDGCVHHFHKCDPIFGCTEGYNNGSESMARITANSDHSPVNFDHHSEMEHMGNYPYGDFGTHAMSESSCYSTPGFARPGSIPDKYSEF